jgi:DNA-directed RNA polymerase alpha subunit
MYLPISRGSVAVIRATHAYDILAAVSRIAEAGPVFYAINKCLAELDSIAKADAIESMRSHLVEDLDISVRLATSLRVREILTIRELESKTAKELLELSRSSSRFFGRKLLRETRDLLAGLGMKLKGDP